MTDIEQDDQIEAASEHQEVELQDQPTEPKMVPLAALQAERQKRQALEARNQVYEELMRNKESQEPEEPEDPNGLVEKHHLNKMTAETKREILEEFFIENNPEAVQKIDKYLKQILQIRPWLASSVDTALNRYARANQIVNDYLHLVEEKPLVKKSGLTDGQRIVQNAHKPGNPITIGKSAQPSGSEYLKSVQGKKEFREYRQKILRGET